MEKMERKNRNWLRDRGRKRREMREKREEGEGRQKLEYLEKG